MMRTLVKLLIPLVAASLLDGYCERRQRRLQRSQRTQEVLRWEDEGGNVSAGGTEVERPGTRSDVPNASGRDRSAIPAARFDACRDACLLGRSRLHLD